MSNNHAEPVEVPEIDDEGEESDDYDDIEVRRVTHPATRTRSGCGVRV